MTLATFSPPVSPSVGAVNKPKISILKAEFGDGYQQVTAAGINHIRAEFSLTWEVLTAAQFDEIMGFLEARRATEPFYWTAPGKSSPQKWTCEVWDSTFNAAGYRQIRATFTESFNLVS